MYREIDKNILVPAYLFLYHIPYLHQLTAIEYMSAENGATWDIFSLCI